MDDFFVELRLEILAQAQALTRMKCVLNSADIWKKPLTYRLFCHTSIAKEMKRNQFSTSSLFRHYSFVPNLRLSFKIKMPHNIAYTQNHSLLHRRFWTKWESSRRGGQCVLFVCLWSGFWNTIQYIRFNTILAEKTLQSWPFYLIYGTRYFRTTLVNVAIGKTKISKNVFLRKSKLL